MTQYSIDWVRALAKENMMAIEAIVSRICRESCEGQSGYALFDGGAHTGYHTVRMSEQPGCERVYAVEADPSMADTLKANLRRAKTEGFLDGSNRSDRATMTVIEKALQNDPKLKAITWKSSTSHVGRSSILSDSGETIWKDAQNIEYRGETSVPATTIDLILKSEKRPLPFLKLDLEGADILSLFGAKKTLKAKRPVVAFENSIHAPKVHGFTLDEFQALLAELDYVAMSFSGERLNAANWFGFFEAWLVPSDKADWLSGRLKAALGVHEKAMEVARRSKGDRTGPLEAARLTRNLDATVVKEADPALPKVTRTVGWRNLSHEVAEALFYHPTRDDQPVESALVDKSWHESRESYLRRVRSVMRSLAKEDLNFEQLLKRPEIEKSTQQWALDTGRFAWLLWLSGRRAENKADHETEKALWAEQASDYRDYVRGALAELRKDGIVFADECASA